MSESNDRPKRPSSYARASTPDLFRKIDTHHRMIASIKRELARRGLKVDENEPER